MTDADGIQHTCPRPLLVWLRQAADLSILKKDIQSRAGTSGKVTDECFRPCFQKSRVCVKIRSITVTGNCNTGGIVEGLRAVLPDVDIVGIPGWELDTDSARAQAADRISNSDLWARMPLPENVQLASLCEPRGGIDLPNLVFSAFHPDIVYANRLDGALFEGITHYHSAIGLWAWRAGLDVETTARLFSPAVMRDLAYDQYWAPAVAAMRADIKESSLGFTALWARLKRSGVFMHTINHPTGPTLAMLAQEIAVRIGAPDQIWDIPAECYVQDFLSHIVWPVYPSVGEGLGHRGCFVWKMGGRTFGGVGEWLEATWAAYGETPRDDVRSSRLDDGVYDHVLGKAVEALRKGAVT